MTTEPRKPGKELTPQELRHFFITHLNRIFCAKSQLIDKLPELASRSHFLDLRQAIEETVEVIENQIGRIKQIYIMLDAWYQPESCVGLAGVLDEAFQSIGSPDDSPALRDLSILFYMQNIESIEKASFAVMMLVSDRFENVGIKQLLLECYDEAREDKILFREITQNYI
jgi:ferritin-like metal-binding protein YciE